jgi:D,D-heptose 1,7-bisphosphate phosphatase
MTLARQAVILAGGMGTRLASRLGGAPKPLVDVDGIPLLERQLRALAEYGFEEALLLVSHKADAIEEFCKAVAIPNIRIIVMQDKHGARGTAGAVSDVSEYLQDTFLVVYGDTLFDIELDRFWQAHVAARESKNVQGSLFLHPNDHPFDSDLVEVDSSNFIQAFHSKPHARGSHSRNLVNAALYILEKSLLQKHKPGNGVVDFGKDFFPKVVEAGELLLGYVTFEYIKDIGTPHRLDKAIEDLRSGKVVRGRLNANQKAVFIDRDGTLNTLNGHIKSPDELSLIDDVPQALASLNQAEYRCVLVTNQPVLARGECTVSQLNQVHAKLEYLLGLEGAYLDATYICPHHPDSGFSGEVAELKRICDCRKPAPGLLLKAIAELSIEPNFSWMIGDGQPDIGAAQGAGVRSILVRTGGNTTTSMSVEPDFEVDDFPAAVDFILRGQQAVEALVSPLLCEIKDGTLIRIAGHSRSGKSVVSSVMLSLLRKNEIQVERIILDRWLLSKNLRPTVSDAKSRIDWTSINDALSSWLHGNILSADTPKYETLNQETFVGGPKVKLPADGILVLDGTLAFNVDPIGRNTLDVFVHCPDDVRWQRFKKEYKRRGMSDHDIISLFQQRQVDEYGLVEQQRSQADFVVSIPSPNKQEAMSYDH